LKVAARQLSAQLHHSLAPVYLVAGDDPLLVAEAAAEVVAAARARGFTQRDVHVCDRSFRWAELAADLTNLSLFATRRVIELRLPTGRPGDVGARTLVTALEHGDPDRVLLLVTPKLDARQPAVWLREVEARGLVVQVWPLERGELPQWLQRRARRAGLELSAAAAELLAERVEGNLLAAAQEIEKLRLFHDAGPVDEGAVAAAVADAARFDVFRLTDALLAGERARAVRVLAGLRAEGVEPVLISWALARELVLLARLERASRQPGGLERELREQHVWPRRHPLLKRALARYRAPELAAWLAAAAELDLIVKGAAPGRSWDAITQLVLAMSGPVGSRGASPVNLERGAAVH
jgi:DNA polymerase-3 subunit delta